MIQNRMTLQDKALHDTSYMLQNGATIYITSWCDTTCQDAPCHDTMPCQPKRLGFCMAGWVTAQDDMIRYETTHCDMMSSHAI